jgi:predicted lipid-binding transport protein (Tim44 family)
MLAILAIGVLISGTVVDDAFARAGRSSRTGIHSSTGWRGSRTTDSGSFQGINQSRRQPAYQSQTHQAQRPSWFQRNPFVAGLMGAVAGSALFAMLGNVFGGFGGMGSGLLTMLLIAGVAMMAMRLFRSKSPPAYAGQPGGQPQRTPDLRQFGGQAFGGGTVTDFGAFRQSREQGLAAIALESPTFTAAKAEDELANVFFRVQEAWSADDRNSLRNLVTPEMFDTFTADLTDMANRHERNVLKGIVVKSFEITEAWQDEGEEFITASIYARLLDYVERDGRIVEGSASEPVDFREVWTFARPRQGAEWRLSAINQV